MAWHKGSDVNGGPGHGIPELGAGPGLARDCKACKYGTLEQYKEHKRKWRCIDCGAVFVDEDS